MGNISTVSLLPNTDKLDYDSKADQKSGLPSNININYSTSSTITYAYIIEANDRWIYNTSEQKAHIYARIDTVEFISTTQGYIRLTFYFDAAGDEEPQNSSMKYAYNIDVNGIRYKTQSEISVDGDGSLNRSTPKHKFRRIQISENINIPSGTINNINIYLYNEGAYSKPDNPDPRIKTQGSITFYAPTIISNSSFIVAKNASTITEDLIQGTSYKTDMTRIVLPDNPPENRLIYIKSNMYPLKIYSKNVTIDKGAYQITRNGNVINGISIPPRAAITLTYNVSTWWILSYYDGTFNNWAPKNTSISYTPISNPIAIANISGAHKYFSLPDPAASTTPPILTVIHAGGNNANYLYINRGAHTLDNNTNADIYIKPDNGNWNACIRFITDKVNWYILDYFYAPEPWYSMDKQGTLTQLRTMDPSKNIIYINSYNNEYDNVGSNNMTSINLTNLPPNKTGIFYIKDIQNTKYAHSIVLKSSTPMFGTGDRLLAYNNTPKKMSGLIITSINNGSTTNHYVVGSYLGYD
jgi:hypothetical protein